MKLKDLNHMDLNSPYKFNYDINLLDNILAFKFTEIDNKIKYINSRTIFTKNWVSIF